MITINFDKHDVFQSTLDDILNGNYATVESLKNDKILEFGVDVESLPKIDNLPKDFCGNIMVNGIPIDDWFENDGIVHINCTANQMNEILKDNFEMVEIR